MVPEAYGSRETTDVLRSFRFTTSQRGLSIPSPILWGSAVAVFLIANFPQHRIIEFAEQTASLIGVHQARFDETDAVFLSVKTTIFALATVILFTPLVLDVAKSSFLKDRRQLLRVFLISAAVMGFLSLLVVPFREPSGLGGLGVHYGEASISPFTQNFGLIHRRLLLPAIAHLTHLTGERFYFLSLVCTMLLIFAFIAFLHVKAALGEPGRPGIRNASFLLLSGVSLGTTSFVIFNFQFPGYVEQAAFILIILCATIEMTAEARLSVVALSLTIHEASIFALLPAIFFLFPKTEVRRALVLTAIYVLAVLMSFGFSLSAIREGQLQIRDQTSFELLKEHPYHALMGILISFKFLWILAAFIVVHLLANGQRWAALALLGILLFPLLMLPVAVDTSRVSGFGFLAILMVVSLLIREFNLLPRWVVMLGLFINLMIPSIYIGVNTGFLSFEGFYRWISSRFPPLG